MKRSPCFSSSQGEVRGSTPKRVRLADVPPVVAPIQDLGEEARCHRVVLETHPIAKTELVAHLDRFWMDCGAEYQFLHSASDPFEMPLLRFPPRDRPGRTFHPLLRSGALRMSEDRALHIPVSPFVNSSPSSIPSAVAVSEYMGFLAGGSIRGQSILPPQDVVIHPRLPDLPASTQSSSPEGPPGASYG